MSNKFSFYKLKDFGQFFVIFGVVFFITASVIFFFGAEPVELKTGESSSYLDDLQRYTLEQATLSEETAKQAKQKQTQQLQAILNGPKPILISIPTIGVKATVYNPTSSNVQVLDQYLLKGAVRYPNSGTLGLGNMFIFGHSTKYQIVNNKAYKTFNSLDKLKEGDFIYANSDTDTYVYKVTAIKVAKAEDAFVDLAGTQNMLTISTCNSFGEKQERIVVQAIFVEKNTI